MSRNLAGRPGLVVFLGGVVCLVASVVLRFYLSHEASARLVQLEPSDYVVKDRGKSVEYSTFLALLFGMNALMWMTFSLGSFLIIMGLRVLTHPHREERPLPPLGSIRDVFENPE